MPDDFTRQGVTQSTGAQMGYPFKWQCHRIDIGAMCSDALYFIILLCLMPDDFTCQEESAGTEWVTAHVSS
jgi:hypothetical protein